MVCALVTCTAHIMAWKDDMPGYNVYLNVPEMMLKGASLSAFCVFKVQLLIIPMTRFVCVRETLFAIPTGYNFDCV